MKIAIIGAGFAGLAIAYFLQELGNVQVTIFEAKKIGGGASGIASGLLHPYPGLSARRSASADEGLRTTKTLLSVAEKYSHRIVSTHSGIYRKTLNKEQHQNLSHSATKWGDVHEVNSDLFLIQTGITVLCENYLEGLSLAIKKRGGEFIYEKISSLNELDGFDHRVIAAGYGIRQFPECGDLKVKFLKGQSLSMKGIPPHEKSFISKGYFAHVGSTQFFEVGSTYEREFTDDLPHIDTAKGLLSDKLALCPDAQIVDCRAGVRVCTVGHYLPILEKIDSKTHVFTGLGSRGLLYHGLYGKMLAHSILSKNGPLL